MTLLEMLLGRPSSSRSTPVDSSPAFGPEAHEPAFDPTGPTAEAPDLPAAELLEPSPPDPSPGPKPAARTRKRYREAPSDNWNPWRVIVDAIEPRLIVGRQDNRLAVTLVNLGTVSVYLAPTRELCTPAASLELSAGATVTISTRAAFYAVAASATAALTGFVTWDDEI